MKHLCEKGPGNTPCRNVRLGEAYRLGRDCRLCWLFAHDVKYNIAWGGDGKVTPAPSPPIEVRPVAPKPILLGDSIESALNRVDRFFGGAGNAKKRIAAWFGDCFGCSARQKAFNDLDQWARDTLGWPADKALDALNKLIGGQ